MGDMYLAAELHIEATASVTYTNGECIIGISMTFSIDIILMSDDDHNNSRSIERKDYSKEHFLTDSMFLDSKEETIKQLYQKWSDYLERFKEDQRLRIIKDYDELNEMVRTIATEQHRYKFLIEEEISSIDKYMNAHTLADKDLKNCYLIMSNAYQLIRDLSLTINLGTWSIRSTVDCTPEMEKVAEKRLTENDQMKIVSDIKLRREYSRKIEELTRQIVDNGRDQVEYSNDISKIEKDIALLQEKNSRNEKLNSINVDQYGSENEKKHINTINEIKADRLRKYEDERVDIQGKLNKTGSLDSSRKQYMEKRLTDIEKMIITLKTEIENNDKKLQQLEKDDEQGTFINEIKGIDEKINDYNNEIEQLRKKIKESEDIVKSSSEEIEKLTKKYEGVVKKLAAAKEV